MSELLMESKLKEFNERSNSRVQAILTENKGWEREYPALMEMLNGDNAQEAHIAKNCLKVMANQQWFMEEVVAKNRAVESTFMANLPGLVPKVIDLVRIFYPNLVTNILVDVQPMDRQNGEVFIVKPIYSNTANGVNAGDQVFQKYTDGNYASENVVVMLGTGNGATTAFTGTAPTLPVKPSTVKVVAGSVTGTDDGKGTITGVGIAAASTIVYATGVYTVNFTVAPAAGVSVTLYYNYDYESTSDTNLKELEIQLGFFPVTAEAHPLRIRWSQQAQLAAAAHLDLDIPDVMTNLAASFIGQERDVKLINAIVASATLDPNLAFNAAPSANYSRLAKYAEIELKINYAESQIQAALGRGGVSWVLCGNNASDIFRQVNGFVPSDIVAPVGPHLIGTLRDGTVSVIKVPVGMNTDTYVVGFKGYVVGDAATILAEWVPLYASPVFQSYNLTSYQGLMSLYAMVLNNTLYYRKGTITGYTA